MADTKPTLERIYVIPLRRRWLLLPRYRRAGRAAKTVKQFIAKHMKVEDRDVGKVKLDVYLNNELWFRGRRNPPSRIKVKAVKEEGIVKVSLAEMPQVVKFRKARHEKLLKGGEKKEAPKEEAKPAEKTAETKEEKLEKAGEKKEEKEKEKAVEQEKLKEAKQDKQVQKHMAKDKKVEFARRSMSRH